MKQLFFISFCILCLTQCKEQTSDTSTTATNIEKTKDQIAIEGVIQNYFDGWLTGDTTLVGSAMHKSCHLKFIRNDTIRIRNRTQYLSGFKPRPRLANAEGRIISINITRNAAEAKIELEIETRIYTDYFNLLKEGNRWYITDKVSTNIAKEK